MSQHWNKLISVVSVLAYLLKYTDDDGMDLYFSISQDKHNAKTSSELVQKLRGKARKGTSDIGSRLSTILHRYQTYLQEPVSNRRSLLGKVKPKLKKALNVYILTDAIWQPHSDATEPIASLITMLKKSDYPRKQVGIQFIRFGDDPGGIDKLEHLDSGLGLSWYVVRRGCSGGTTAFPPKLMKLVGTSSMQNPQTAMCGRCSSVPLTNGSMAIKMKPTTIRPRKKVEILPHPRFLRSHSRCL
jgi:hypothetical protein